MLQNSPVLHPPPLCFGGQKILSVQEALAVPAPHKCMRCVSWGIHGFPSDSQECLYHPDFLRGHFGLDFPGVRRGVVREEWEGMIKGKESGGRRRIGR